MRDFLRLLGNRRFRKTMRMIFLFAFQFWLLDKQKRFFKKEKLDRKRSIMYAKQAKFFTETATEMGGLIIKLGQHISARVDVLPREYTAELSKLQDSVAPVPLKQAMAVIEAELGKSVADIFAELNETPIGAASLGQVYKATLKTGQAVAVKVLRPNIDQIIEIDLKSLQVAIQLLKRYTKINQFMNLNDIYDEFDDVLRDELDYEIEASNLEKFQLHFLANDDIIVPHVHPEYSTKKVLTMDYIDGVKINEFEKLDEWGIDRKRIAEIFFTAYVQQVVVDGFFHADPHPGNILVQKDGRVAFIDFGMMGSITSQMKEQLFNVIMAVYLRDINGAIEALQKLHFLRSDVDLTVLSKSLHLLFDQIMGKDVDLQMFQQADFQEELREFLYDQPFQIPSRTTFLGKAVITVFGVCSSLYPTFDFVKTGKPYIEDMMKKDFGTTFKLLLDQGTTIVKGIIPTSKKIISVVDKIDSGNMRVKLPNSFEEKLTNNQQFQTNKIIWSIIGASAFLTGGQFYLAENEYGLYLMAGGGVVALWQLRKKPPNERLQKKREKIRARHQKMIKK